MTVVLLGLLLCGALLYGDYRFLAGDDGISRLVIMIAFLRATIALLTRRLIFAVASNICICRHMHVQSHFSSCSMFLRPFRLVPIAQVSPFLTRKVTTATRKSACDTVPVMSSCLMTHDSCI